MSEPARIADKAVRVVRHEVDAVVTHHLDGFRSGVARFNELLAKRLGVPLLGLPELRAGVTTCPLHSFKVSELGDSGSRQVEEALDGYWQVFLHEYRGVELERRLVTGAQRVHCGNAAIRDAVAGIAADARTLWTPGLLVDDRVFPSVEISVFSFGMAHKVRVDIFRKLRSLLEESGRSYAVYVSAANHETASLRDSEVVFNEMHDVFPHELYFLGNLSDVAVFNHLRAATFFAAFFEHGVRANNTSVASAMERGAIVITNLDKHSPPEYVHMKNLIDIQRCDRLPSEPHVLDELSLHATETGSTRGWSALTDALR
jgi:hypothetical protein